MPKIIACTKEDILAEAKRQARENGYNNLSIKSIAAACGVAVGTIYNYFSSKDMLVASFILSDWFDVLSLIEKELNKQGLCGVKGIRLIYEKLTEFNDNYKFIFCDRATVWKPRYNMPDKHKLLKEQIAKLIESTSNVDSGTALFIADILLSYSVEKTKYEDIEKYIEKLI